MNDELIKINHDVNWKVIAESNLLAARAMLSMAHNAARMHIKENGAIELRDMAEDAIYEIDMYGKNHITNWQPQDLGAI